MTNTQEKKINNKLHDFKLKFNREMFNFCKANEIMIKFEKDVCEYTGKVEVSIWLGSVLCEWFIVGKRGGVTGMMETASVAPYTALKRQGFKYD